MAGVGKKLFELEVDLLWLKTAGGILVVAGVLKTVATTIFGYTATRMQLSLLAGPSQELRREVLLTQFIPGFFGQLAWDFLVGVTVIFIGLALVTIQTKKREAQEAEAKEEAGPGT
ncbi:MAG: hypothetical protein DRO11_10110 [Methanobacteriota archaeon]|nr:MAG: hypothetical protein DRO11_10110 [Euryarchaeota archaeon]